MAWKPQEKELTVEEAIELAKKNLTQFWIKSAPLVTAIQSNGSWVAFPLEKDFVKKSWLLLFADPTRFSGKSLVLFAKEWYRRYHTHEIDFLLLFSPVYPFYKKNLKSFEEMLEKLDLQIPIAIDHNNGLFEYFGASVLPKVIFLSNDKRVFENSGDDVYRISETEIQNFLRSSDPGLPLLPVLHNPAFLYKDLAGVELGYRSPAGSEATFTEGGFIVNHEESRKGTFLAARPKSIPVQQIFLRGTWLQYPDRLLTSDPTAMIGFNSPSTDVLLIAQRQESSTKRAHLAIELNDLPIPDSYSGEALGRDEFGSGIIEVTIPKVHHILTGLPESKREVTLRFPDAAQSQIEIFGLRFGQRG